MEQRQLDELYELASEHYLNGRFAEALQAWRQLLDLNPDDERAQEGIRLAELMAEGEVAPAASSQPAGVPVHAVPASTPEPGTPGQAIEIEEDLLGPASPEPVPEVIPEAGTPEEEELDDNLAVLDSLSVPGMITAPAARDEAHDASAAEVAEAASPAQTENQRKEIDFGDLTELDAIPTVAAPETPAEPTAEPAAAESVGLAELSQRATFAPPPTEAPKEADDGSDPVAIELKKRIDDLMKDATGAADEGRDEDALGLLSRVFILDEEHAGGRALEEAIRAREGDAHVQIETWMTEAVQWLELGQVVEARDRFRQVLEQAPDHLEAQDYLAKAEAKLAGEDDAGEPEALIENDAGGLPGDDGFAELNHEPMAEQAGVEGVPLAVPVGATAVDETVARDDPAPAATKSAPPRKIPVVLLLVMVVVIGLAAAGYLYGPDFIDRFFASPEATPSGGESGTPAPATSAGEPGDDPSAAAVGAPVPNAPPAQRKMGIGEALDRARDAMAANDYSTAIVAYNEALSLDPGNAEAQDGIREAGDLYREQRAAEEQVERGRIALEDGDYVAALRILYRVPAGVDQNQLARYKVIGWYNLGLVELKSADCDTALEHFDEALALAPEEERIRRASDLAEQYAGAPKDRDFYRRIESMEFLVP